MKNTTLFLEAANIAKNGESAAPQTLRSNEHVGFSMCLHRFHLQNAQKTAELPLYMKCQTLAQGNKCHFRLEL